MTSYEHALSLYTSFHEAYSWTKKEIDDEEFEYILDLLVKLANMRNTEDKPKKKFIDEMF